MNILLHGIATIIMWNISTAETKNGNKLSAFIALCFSAANGAMIFLELAKG